jgi:hypothetical protein
MAASSIFLIQAFVIVAVPVVLLRISGLKGLLPLVAVQIMLGIALGPSFFGKVAPAYFQMFASAAALSSLTGLATVAVMIFGLISGLHVDPAIFNGKERLSGPILDSRPLSRRASPRRWPPGIHRGNGNIS